MRQRMVVLVSLFAEVHLVENHAGLGLGVAVRRGILW